MDFYQLGVKLALASVPDWLPGKFKQREKSIKNIDMEMSSPDWVATPKIDGVGTAIRLQAGQRPIIFTAEPKKTGPREHTGKVTTFEDVRVPKSLDDTVVRAELFGVDNKGKPIPVRDIVGMVNAGTEQSLRRQREKNVRLVPALLTVERFKGKDTTGLPFEKQIELIKKIKSRLPQFVVPDYARTPEEKQTLLNLIKAKQHPLTEEGLVFHNLHSGKSRSTTTTVKAKFRPDFDVYVRNIFPGKGSREGNAAGGFEYSWTPRGNVVGRVGTGFSHALLRDMLRHPTRYIGRVARVRSPHAFPGAGPDELGALRAPSFKEWHPEKGKQEG